MGHLYGSLDKFLMDIPEISRYSKNLNRTRMNLSAARQQIASKPSNLNYSPESLCMVEAKSFGPIRNRSTFTKKPRTGNKSLMPLTDNEKIRTGLM